MIKHIKLSKCYHHVTKLGDNFKYERLLEQEEVTNVSGFYRDYANAVKYKQGLSLGVRVFRIPISQLQL